MADMTQAQIDAIANQVNPYSAQIEALNGSWAPIEQSINDALAAAIAAQEARNQATINDLEGNRPGIQQGYDRSAQQAYIQNMLQQRDLPQRMAALGLNGGASESSLVRLQNQYGNNLNNLTQQYNNDINALDRAIANARLQGEAAIGDINNQWSVKLADAQRDWNNQLLNAQLQAQMWDTEHANELALAKAQLAAQNAPARSSGGGYGRGYGSGSGGGSGNPSPTPGSPASRTQEDILDLIRNEEEHAGNQYTLNTAEQIRNRTNTLSNNNKQTPYLTNQYNQYNPSNSNSYLSYIRGKNQNMSNQY